MDRGKSNFLESLFLCVNPGKQAGISIKLTWSAGEKIKPHTSLQFEHEGSVYVVRRNIHNAGVSLSGEGLDKALSGKVANEFIESALGMGFSTAYETCWTPQGSLVQVLVMSHSQRVAFFQRLADIRRAETIRGMLNDSHE